MTYRRLIRWIRVLVDGGAIVAILKNRNVTWSCWADALIASCYTAAIRRSKLKNAPRTARQNRMGIKLSMYNGPLHPSLIRAWIAFGRHVSQVPHVCVAFVDTCARDRSRRRHRHSRPPLCLLTIHHLFSLLYYFDFLFPFTDRSMCRDRWPVTSTFLTRNIYLYLPDELSLQTKTWY